MSAKNKKQAARVGASAPKTTARRIKEQEEKMYRTGFDFWRDMVQEYGREKAVNLAKGYLDMQIKNGDPEELRFCRELYSELIYSEQEAKTA